MEYRELMKMLCESFISDADIVTTKNLTGNVHRLQIDLICSMDRYGVRVLSLSDPLADGLFTTADRIKAIGIYNNLTTFDKTIDFISKQMHSVDTEGWQIIVKDEGEFLLGETGDVDVSDEFTNDDGFTEPTDGGFSGGFDDFGGDAGSDTFDSGSDDEGGFEFESDEDFVSDFEPPTADDIGADTFDDEPVSDEA